MGNKLRDFTISIYATDIDEESLKKAERGEYEGLSMEKVKREYIDRYFTYTGRYKVKDEIRRSVRFKRHDLISENALTHFNIILCRNALIYFSRNMQEKLFTQFHQGLNKGGYLVIGKTETLTVEAMKMFRAVDVGERIYQKLWNRQPKGRKRRKKKEIEAKGYEVTIEGQLDEFEQRALAEAV